MTQIFKLKHHDNDKPKCAVRLQKAKQLVFFYNILLWILSCVVLVVSTWLLTDSSAKFHLNIIGISAWNAVHPGLFFVVCVGGLTFLAGFLICCGTAKENRCMLMTIFGALILAISIWLLTDPNVNNYLKAVSNTGQPAAIVVLCIGLLVAAMCSIGCCAIQKESQCLLMVYACVLIVIFIVELVAGSIVVAFRTEMLLAMAKKVNAVVQEQYGKPNNSAVTRQWDSMQSELRCCGALKLRDWENSWWRKNVANWTQTVPSTCCTLENGFQTLAAQRCYNYEQGFIHQTGCTEKLMEWIEKYAGILGSITFGIATPKLFGIGATFWLSNTIKKNSESTCQYI